MTFAHVPAVTVCEAGAAESSAAAFTSSEQAFVTPLQVAEIVTGVSLSTADVVKENEKVCPSLLWVEGVLSTLGLLLLRSTDCDTEKRR